MQEEDDDYDEDNDDENDIITDEPEDFDLTTQILETNNGLSHNFQNLSYISLNNETILTTTASFIRNDKKCNNVCPSLY